MSRLAWREAMWFYGLVGLWIVGFVLFTGGPILASAVLSFTKYDIVTPPRWIGLENYNQLFTNDPLFWQSLRVTFVYSILAIPLGLIASMVLALLMNQKVRGIALWRTLYYLPSVISGVPVALLWLWIFNPQFGIVNWVLSLFGIQGPGWLLDDTWVLPAFVIISLWGLGGGMVIYLAGLQGIPTHLYEAAEIDGATAWSRFWHVTLPMMSPVIFFNLIIGIINSFQTFTLPYVMTRGGPDNASMFYGLNLFFNGFQYFKMGYASALAWILFTVILVLVIIAFKTSSLWVYYEGQGPGR
jgi:multiple sugar transport system permease protein